MVEESGEKKGGEVDLTQLTDALVGLPEGVQNAVKTAIREVSNENNAAAQEAARAAKAAEADDDDISEAKDFDVERVSRAELVAHIDKRFSMALAKGLKPIMDRLESNSTDVETDRVRTEFAKAQADHSDFMEWKEEMRAIITDHPGLSADAIYKLARANDPTKAAEIDEKAKEGKGEEGEKARSERRRAFGGLMPTSGVSLEKDGKKQPKEAASAAWEEVMGQVPADVLGQALEG